MPYSLYNVFIFTTAKSVMISDVIYRRKKPLVPLLPPPRYILSMMARQDQAVISMRAQEPLNKKKVGPLLFLGNLSVNTFPR
jgi:hypothetical protein